MQDIIVAYPAPYIGSITINRPDARNALRSNTLQEISQSLNQMDNDDKIRVVIISGGDKIFAAGADIKEMEGLNVIGTLSDVRGQYWKNIANFSKPLIAAVNGYALGAGCELAMTADIIIAGNSAKFGQPEINLGIIPGAGGTQRLVRIIGKGMAMKMVLSGEFLSANDALTLGLVTEITQNAYERSLALATTITSKSPLALRLAKELILKSYETGLELGLNLERKAFCLLAASDDRREGIAAFKEKRPATFSGK